MSWNNLPSAAEHGDRMLRHVVTSHALHQLIACLGAACLVGDIIDQDFQLLARQLVDPAAICAILPAMPDGVLRVVYDPAKPNVADHIRAMVCEWWASGSPLVMNTLPALPALN